MTRVERLAGGSFSALICEGLTYTPALCAAVFLKRNLYLFMLRVFI